MDGPAAATLLFVAGAAMGFVNNLAGAGGVLALLAFDLVGLPTQVANASMRPAALGIAGAGALGFRSTGRRIPKRAIGYALTTLPGAVLGTWLAVALPEWVYETALFCVVAYLAVLLLRRPQPGPVMAPAATRGSRILWFSLVGLHMGFLQVGAGLLAIVALSHVHSRDLVHVNVAKMALVAASATASVVAFSTTDLIAWGPALWLATGAGVGSYVAATFSVRRGHGAIRAVVLGVCGLMMLRIVVRLVGSF